MVENNDVQDKIVIRQALKKDAEIGIICAVGGQAALTARTMKDMGFENVVNLGGVNGWAEAGGPMED